MPQLAKVKDCTGCAACSNACAHGAITMTPIDRLGSLYPQVNNDACVECKLCERVCPALRPVKQRLPQKVFAAWSKDITENKKSTSGGLATIFSKKILQAGGIVYGCSSIGMDVKHIRIDDIKDVDELRGSKYVQSLIGDVYKRVRKDLLSKTQVLFIGTPCQVAGLLSFLRKPYDNLLTVDLICHGTPSLRLLQEHEEKIAPNKKITKVGFRDGGTYSLNLYSDKDLIYSSNLWKKRYEDAYFNAFIKGYTFRESCYTCRYAHKERCSDITIGDFWGLGKEKPFHSDSPNAGISVALVNTNKGAQFLSANADALNLYERPLDEAVNGNPQLKSPKKKTLAMKVFRHLYMKSGFSLKGALYTTDFYLLPVYYILNKIKNR